MAGVVIAILFFERRRPARKLSRPLARRIGRNIALGALSMGAAGLLESPLARRLARSVVKGRSGLVQQIPLPHWARDLLAVAAMDYTIYLWHVATHRIPFLWRFHLVHHLDRELDSTTALRFHFAEIIVSVPYRLLQVRVIGTSERALLLWQRLFFMSVLFHHSNLRLPDTLERRLELLLTTPRMHRIHHSDEVQDTNSNWSSGLSIWDRLHGTLRARAPDDSIRIGAPNLRVEDGNYRYRRH